MSDTTSAALPAYTADAERDRLLEAGASGTVYALVMPETEAAVRENVADIEATIERHREPWTRKQDGVHTAWFDEWIKWASPIVDFDADAFAHRYPTAGASEAIAKIMAEWANKIRARGGTPVIHVFEGEYEGFRAFAAANAVPFVTHDRSNWADACTIDGDAQFWISQPSAIDGMVWPHLKDFLDRMETCSPYVEVVPDLSYVGAVAHPFRIMLDHANVRSFVVSMSKPFGVYFKRIGGAFSRDEIGSLFGNRWFKNIDMLALGTAMMQRYGVHELATRYRRVQEEAAIQIGRRLGIPGLVAADVVVMGVAPAVDADDANASLLRGSPDQQVTRVCLTPAMTIAIDPALAPDYAATLDARWVHEHQKDTAQ